jgi:hypothetical protein
LQFRERYCHFASALDNSLDVAKGFAERVAAVLGHHRSDEEIDGLFIRVTDAAEAELFRTPVRNDPSLGTLH